MEKVGRIGEGGGLAPRSLGRIDAPDCAHGWVAH